MLDIKLHMIEPPKTVEELDKIFVDNKLEHNIFSTIYKSKQYASFSHIFVYDYAAGYYSYLWAEVLDKDAFELFKEKGIFDPETAKAFRKNILEKGGSDDPMKLYKQFRGAEPNPEAMIKGRGL